jgi:Protein of unknown function (DUF3995)
MCADCSTHRATLDQAQYDATRLGAPCHLVLSTKAGSIRSFARARSSAGPSRGYVVRVASRPQGGSARAYRGVSLAYAACAWAVAFALPSFYWAAGGSIGAEPIAADVEKAGLSNPAVLAITGILKLLAGMVALALARRWGGRLSRRLLGVAASGAGGLFVVYALANFVDHGLMQSGARGVPEALGRYALHWHLLLWDPWWLLGGVLFLATARTLAPGRPDRRVATA